MDRTERNVSRLRERSRKAREAARVIAPYVARLLGEALLVAVAIRGVDYLIDRSVGTPRRGPAPVRYLRRVK